MTNQTPAQTEGLSPLTVYSNPQETAALPQYLIPPKSWRIVDCVRKGHLGDTETRTLGTERVGATFACQGRRRRLTDLLHFSIIIVRDDL